MTTPTKTSGVQDDYTNDKQRQGRILTKENPYPMNALGKRPESIQMSGTLSEPKSQHLFLDDVKMANFGGHTAEQYLTIFY
jgi:hypothetical protein